MKATMIEIVSVPGLIAIIVTIATVVFIWAGITMPDWWGAVVISTIMARLFGRPNGDKP